MQNKLLLRAFIPYECPKSVPKKLGDSFVSALSLFKFYSIKSQQKSK